MYKIEIKKHPTIADITTKNLIYAVLNSMPKDGLSDDEGRLRKLIRESVTELGDNPILLLEDAEFKVLIEIINSMGKKYPDGTLRSTGWQFQDDMVWDFCDEMRGLKSFKPAKLTEASENGIKEPEIVEQ